MPPRLTTKDIQKRIKDNFPEYELIGEYINTKSKIKIRHNCGYEYDITAKTFLSGGGLCPICYKPKTIGFKKSINQKEMQKRLNDYYKSEEYTILEYKVEGRKSLVKHNICGHEWLADVSAMTCKRHQSCPICANKKRGKHLRNPNYLQNLVRDEPDYLWLEDYKGRNCIKHKIIHLKCGHEYEVRPGDFRTGYRCPYCSKGIHRSKDEDELKEFFESFYDKEIIYNYKPEGKRQDPEVDVYIPDLNIGFEYNGFFWHCDKNKDKKYHLNKLKYFQERGIEIYFIDEIDWINPIKQKIIKNKVKYLMHCSDALSIYARQCTLKYNLSNEKKTKFLNKYHIQGNVNNTFNLYLSYDKKIVALMTFGKPRFNKENDTIELLRYVTNSKYNIIGGFSKLLKHAIYYIKENDSNIKTIISYADINWSRGKVYKKCGFELDHISDPSYYYVYKKEKINRQRYQKKKLKNLFPNYYNENYTEFQICDSVPGLYRVWNTGNYVFKFNLKEE